jgi:predicted outer membrane repeat protein
VSDYDGDGLSDYDEVIVGWHVKWTDSYGTEREYDVLSDPASADQDADGSNDLEEKTAGTDPSNPDTDRDGIPDRDDPAPLTQARVLYVDQNAEGDNNGRSWAHAYTDLQAALAEARVGYNNNGDESPNLTDDVAEIWVAQGVYIPSQVGDRTVPFVLVPTVGVYGGFRGGNDGSYPGETKRSQRDKDPRTNGTVLSGDLAGDDPDNDADNSNTVLKALEGGARHTVLDGFQIRGGNNTHTETWGNPGGMYVGRPLTLKNLFFAGNRSLQGPGALTVRLPNENDELNISHCVYIENQTDDVGGAVRLYYNKGSVSFIDCKLQGNKAKHGGAIYGQARQLTLMNTVITDNEALTNNGGGIFIAQDTPVQIMNSEFTQNSAFYFGGGIYAQGNNDIQIIQSLFNENHTGANNEGNWDKGGAIYLGGECHLYMVNSTLTKNTTDGSGDYSKGGGIWAEDTATLRIDNCILWGNNDNAPNDWFSNQIEGRRANWTINTSCIQNYAGVANQISGFGNVSLCVAGASDCDPLIDVDGTLNSGCACIDKGNNYVDFEPSTAGFQTLPEIDLAGKPRLVDGDTDGFADVDMGAYEYQP